MPAVKHNVNIVGGLHFVEEDGSPYNVSFLFRRDGAIERQHKLHITPHQKAGWAVQPGSGLNIFETGCGKIAIMIL